MENLKKCLEESKQTKKGMTFFVNGNVIQGYVVNISDDSVELKNREVSKIIILLNRIDAASLS